MGQITSLFARKVVGVAGNAIDASAVLASVGVDVDGEWDPKHMLDDDDYYGMIELMAEQMDITSLPLIVGEAMRPDEYGALGLAWKAAPNLLGSFSRVSRYWRLWTSVTQYELEETDRGVLYLQQREGLRRLGMRISIEATSASGVSLGRQGECPIFCVTALWSMLPERSKDDDDFQGITGRTFEGLRTA